MPLRPFALVPERASVLSETRGRSWIDSFGENMRLATIAADRFHAQFNANQFQAIYDEATPAFQSGGGRDPLLNAMKQTKRLAGHEYLAGPYSIADMACYPWVVPWERQGQKLGDFPHVKRWFEAIKARSAVIKAYEWTPKINPGAGGIRTAEERAILFGQTAQSVASMAGTKQ